MLTEMSTTVTHLSAVMICDLETILFISIVTQVWFGLLLFNGTFSTNRLHRAIEVQCISHRAGEQHNHTIEQCNNRTKKIAHTLRHGLFGDDSLATVRLPQRSLSSQSLGRY